MTQIFVEEKYEHNGWPSLDRPDLKPPEGWSLELINSLNHIHHHALSPDGEQVAFVWERDACSDIYALATKGGWPWRVSTGREKTIYWWDSAPVWSPDSRWLAFVMGGHVHVVPADGRGLPKKVTDFTGGGSSPVWLPDSRRLIAGVERKDATQLIMTDTDGSWPRPIAMGNGDCGDAQVSPDGKRVVYGFRPFADLNRWDLHLVDLASGTEQLLTGAPRQKDWSPRWSPDGLLIAFLSQRSGYTEVWLVGSQGQGLRQLTQFGRDVDEITWSPDGRRLAASVNHDAAGHLVLIDAGSGDNNEIKTGPGIYSSLHWSSGGDFLTAEFESTSRPPDILRIEVDSGRETQLTFSMPPALSAHELITPQHVRYASYDRLEIPALLWQPRRPNGAAIVRPHGGPADQYRFHWDILAQYWLAKGYTFLTPNFRGSSGYGAAFEQANYNDWGLGDTQDVLAGAGYLASEIGIDRNRIGIMGSSYGGYLVACCLARDPEYRFACGVSKNGDANVYSSWAQCERMTRLYTEMMIGHPGDNWPVYRAASPISEMANVRKPVLLLHGLADDVVPPQASEEWAQALKRHDKVYEYKTYAGEPHGFLRHQTEIDWQRRTERFFDWYLRP